MEKRLLPFFIVTTTDVFLSEQIDDTHDFQCSPQVASGAIQFNSDRFGIRNGQHCVCEQPMKLFVTARRDVSLQGKNVL